MYNPLVSIIVITYKSAKYVSQTLESIKAQTYDNIELIISDDCSPDDTLKVCEQFIKKNWDKNRSNVTIVTTQKNGGICANYNNGLKYAKGVWIKYIAGDDILESDCIKSFVNATILSNDKLFICGTKPFTNDGTKLPYRLLPPDWFKGDYISQEKLLVKKGTIIEGPTFFIHAETLRKLGAFDEKYPFIEDYPLYMKFLKNGYRIHLVEKYLIRYREYPESVSKCDNRFERSIFQAIEDFAIPAAKKNRMFWYWWHEIVEKYARHHMNSPVNYLLVLTDFIGWKKRMGFDD